MAAPSPQPSRAPYGHAHPRQLPAAAAAAPPTEVTEERIEELLPDGRKVIIDEYEHVLLIV